MAAEVLDAAILGAGPAGLSAGIYLARAGLKCTVFSSGPIGGALQEISKISNYPGFLGSGPELAETMKKQAELAGARIEYGKCTSIKKAEKDGSDTRFMLEIDGAEILARAVLIASGSEPKTLPFEPSKPVSYCALCDGDLIKDKNVAVIGGGNSALQEALYLAGLAKKVTVISHSALRAEQCLQSRAQDAQNMEILEGIEPTIKLLDGFDHIFVYIGKQPASGYLRGLDKRILDERGEILTGEGGQQLHETAVSGLFAAGDIRSGAVRQVVTAAADGATSAIEIIDFLKNADSHP